MGSMFSADPKIRKTFYWVTFVIAIVIIVMKRVHTGWAGDVVDAGNELITYLAGLTTLIAAGNVNKTLVVEPPKE